MNTEISGVILQWTLLVTLCYPLGRYIAKVYRGERTWLDFMAPVERGIYRFCGIDPAVEMNWKQFLKALLTVNLFWFFWGMLLLVFQGWLPLNPDGNPGQSPDLAFNTCISFMVNCNLSITAARRACPTSRSCSSACSSSSSPPPAAWPPWPE